MKLLKLGSRGQSVTELQEALTRAQVYTGDITGVFGPLTQAAVIEFQRRNNLVADGIVGERTKIALQLVRGDGVSAPTKSLKESDLQEAARTLNCEIAAIKAVSEVESNGGGFLSDGKIKVLFERHIFNRRLNHYGLSLASELGRKERPDLVNTATGGYRGGAHENTRLEMAMRLNKECALESASYGRYQIMGFHWQTLGYKDVQEFVDLQEKNEGEQLKAFVKFIQADTRLLRAIRDKDWTTFARVYNGPAFAKNQYDTKMKEAYERLSK